jgi:hypothetical protein
MWGAMACICLAASRLTGSRCAAAFSPYAACAAAAAAGKALPLTQQQQQQQQQRAATGLPCAVPGSCS